MKSLLFGFLALTLFLAPRAQAETPEQILTCLQSLGYTTQEFGPGTWVIKVAKLDSRLSICINLAPNGEQLWLMSVLQDNAEKPFSQTPPEILRRCLELNGELSPNLIMYHKAMNGLVLAYPIALSKPLASVALGDHIDKFSFMVIEVYHDLYLRPAKN